MFRTSLKEDLPLSHELYRLLAFLDETKLHYRIDRHRPDTVLVTVTAVGDRIEIDVFDDGHIEFCRFTGSEGPSDDVRELMTILAWHRDDDGARSAVGGPISAAQCEGDL
jgi:hypothetical protein